MQVYRFFFFIYLLLVILHTDTRIHTLSHTHTHTYTHNLHKVYKFIRFFTVHTLLLFCSHMAMMAAVGLRWRVPSPRVLGMDPMMQRLSSQQPVLRTSPASC